MKSVRLKSATSRPGSTARTARPRSSATACSFAEKQKAKRIYFVQEEQFRNYFEFAARKPGVTGELLLQQLERRLDNIVYRMGFAVARRQARQFVRHGHVEVNGRKVNIPSYEVKAGDEIAIREKSRTLPIIQQAMEYTAHQAAPGWLEVNRETLKGKVVNLPKREDINLPVNEQLIVELYSK